MKRKFYFSDETQQAAHRLLTANEEMLHEWSLVAPSTFCVHCKAFRGSAPSDEECSVLLRCALQMLTRPLITVSEPPADMQIGKHKTIGLHLHRPYADEQRTKEEPALCGNVSGTFVVVAEGVDLLTAQPKYPMAAYCLRCASIHTGKSVSEVQDLIFNDHEEPLERWG